MEILSRFHPILYQWFNARYGRPTAVQEKAWAAIAAQKHVIISAPTGSGKTLAAFLWAIDEILSGKRSPGKICILYISPLKALNNDIQKNLLRPLEELKALFSKKNEPFPSVSVMTRSGDTPQYERRRMLSAPPEILITTPESLNLLLSSQAGSRLFDSLATVILDEIHAVIESKRGTHLMTAVERLTRISGEFQRISLSATVKPLSLVARYVAGRQLVGAKRECHYKDRPIEIVEASGTKAYALSIIAPQGKGVQSDDETWWSPLVTYCLSVIQKNRSTLIFTGSRKKTEKIARLINEAAGNIIAYSHHGALSKEIRLFVENLFKDGKLKAIVATGTLELGIDIGELDEVILLQSPYSVAQAVQRIGRSGHAIDGVSRASLVPLDGVDLLHLGALARAVTDHSIETVHPPDNPLDVLAQVVISLTGTEAWNIDDLYGFIRTAYAYRDLSRHDFDSVLSLLAGKYEQTRIPELRPRVITDRLTQTVKARKGSLLLLYTSGGMIPDRGHYELRLIDSHTRLGELDEEFVWERNIGDTFVFGPSVWRIQQITQSAVLVKPADLSLAMIPFYRAEEQNRSYSFSEKILTLLERLSTFTGNPAGAQDFLINEHYFTPDSAQALLSYLAKQTEWTGLALPHRKHMVIEHCQIPYSRGDTKIVLLHTFWGGKVNKPFGEAFSFLWEQKFSYALEYYATNDTILFHLPHGFSPDLLLEMLSGADLNTALFQHISGSALFGAVFRENAGRALLLPRGGFSRRVPFWLTRIKSKNLLSAILAYPEFPLLKETLANLKDTFFDLAALQRLQGELIDGTIKISETTTTQPSPFATHIVWYMTNQYMYQTDESKGARNLPLRTLEETLADTKILPAITRGLIDELESKLKRTHPSYAPKNADELFLHLQERLLIPFTEWQILLEAIAQDHGLAACDTIKPLEAKTLILTPPFGRPLVTLLETVPDLCLFLACELKNLTVQGLNGTAQDPLQIIQKIKNIPGIISSVEKNASLVTEACARQSDILSQYMRFFGPVSLGMLCSLFGLSKSVFNDILTDLLEDDVIISGALIENDTTLYYCDKENYNRLLRMKRSARRLAVKQRDIGLLPVFLADWHELIQKPGGAKAIQVALERLFGLPAKAFTWEESIFPARVGDYTPATLDALLQTTGLQWAGSGKERVMFLFSEDKALLATPKEPASGIRELFPDQRGRYALEDLVTFTGLAPANVLEKLWEGVWTGIVSNTTFETVRQGLNHNFKFSTTLSTPKRRSRWNPSIPSRGFWYLLETAEPSSDASDPLTQLEQNKERVRVLLDRYGVLFKEILTHESPLFGWSKIFPALRLMELSGEIIGGSFFEGIPGIQFMSHRASARLSSLSVSEVCFWINAADPVSVAGKGLHSLRETLPDRSPTSYMVFQGTRLKLVLKKNGSALEFFDSPHTPLPESLFKVFTFLLSRGVNPLKQIKVRHINGGNALVSPYKQKLIAAGFTEEYKSLVLRKTY